MKKARKKKILIIERHDDFRESLSELLSLHDYQIINAKNGYLGLAFAHEYLPDLIICARSFADTDCWDVLQELRKEVSTRDLPFIFLSSKPASDEHQKICAQESVWTMVKPFLTEELIGLIRQRFTVTPPRNTKRDPSDQSGDDSSEEPGRLNAVKFPFRNAG